MSKVLKRYLIMIAFGVILFVGLMNLNEVLRFAGSILTVTAPVYIGMIVAFVLNVPINGFEKLVNKFFKNKKHRPSESLVTKFCTFSVIIAIIAVLTLIATITGPEIAFSVKSVYVLIQEKWPTWVDFLEKYNIDISGIADWFSTSDFQTVLDNIISGSGSVIDTVIGAATSTISSVVTAIFASVIAVYLLLAKKVLGRQAILLMNAYLKPGYSEKVIHVATLSKSIYAKFLSGQCVEAIILGLLIFIALTIFRLPYAVLTAVLTAVFAFVPYIGAFASLLIGAFFTLIVNPNQVILFVIVYTVVQFVESQFIYPHVVGNSVGLSALWTLIAALVGGKLLGLVGIIFFIPLTAVIYTIFKEAVYERLHKNMSDGQFAVGIEDASRAEIPPVANDKENK